MEIFLQFYGNDDQYSESVRNICQKYWETENRRKFKYKIKEICKDENITEQELRKIITESCYAYTKEVSCLLCNKKFFPFKSRNDFLRTTSNYKLFLSTEWTCEDCESEIRKTAEEKEENEKKEKYNLILDIMHIKQTDYIDINNINLENAIFLLSAIRALASENLEFLYPYEESGHHISPTTKLDYNILSQLFDHGLILVHPEYSLDSVILNTDDRNFAFYPSEVYWLLPLSGNGESNSRFVEKLEDIIKSDNWPYSWNDECNKLCRKVCLHECFQYLHLCLERHGFNHSIGEKTELVINKALNNFSVGQLYNFIWKASRDAASIYMRKRVSKRYAANCVPGSIQRTADRALAEGWEVKNFRRDFETPRSIVSNVLFDTALQIGERAFYERLF